MKSKLIKLLFFGCICTDIVVQTPGTSICYCDKEKPAQSITYHFCGECFEKKPPAWCKDSPCDRLEPYIQRD